MPANSFGDNTVEAAVIVMGLDLTASLAASLPSRSSPGKKGRPR